MAKRWIFRSPPETHQVSFLAASLSVHPTIASLLVQKGITNFDQAKAYFRPSLEALHDPFMMKNMDKAVHRLARALGHKEPILVYGDYDVDGVTSVAMFYGFLKNLQAHTDFYIPDRYAEGYGISMQAVSWAAQAGFKLIVSLDCGIKATACIQQANALGMDVIVADHHEPGDVLPDAYAILDPKQQDCAYPDKALSGCGVGFKLLQALTLQQGLPEENVYDYLDLVAVSIACDIVPIVGENRVLAYHGLKKLNTVPRLGLKALIEICNLKPPLSIAQLVFSLGPRINAAGRMDRANLAVRLLLAKDPTEAAPLAHTLNQKNILRRDIDHTTTEEAIAMINANSHLVSAKTTVLFKDNWHKGVIGIVASRCIEQHYRPTVILTVAQGKATGSARSVAGYNIYQALSACADLLDQYGGHAYAAGLTLPLEHLEAFQQRFEEVVASSIADELLIPPQEIDLPLVFEEINFKFHNVIKQMAPFGTGNMKAVFSAEKIVARSYNILQGKHLKLCVHQQGSDHVLEAIGFGLAYYEPLVCAQLPFSMVYTIEENNYLGKRSLQLNIKDLRAM
ncbi:MAG TPA: single-stranded-DNA-specific exonuclease RecJ [Amoebophilaceae bacterium]|nr:single-stranded-DNA-specific exonuclease RecJ [Amoebophilaceae bacterium]